MKYSMGFQNTNLCAISQARFVHVRKSEIQGLFKDFQGHVSGNSRTNGLKRRLCKAVKGNHEKIVKIAENVTKTKARRIQGLSSTSL